MLAHWTITRNTAPGIPDMQPREVSEECLHGIATVIADVDALGVSVG